MLTYFEPKNIELFLSDLNMYVIIKKTMCSIGQKVRAGVSFFNKYFWKVSTAVVDADSLQLTPNFSYCKSVMKELLMSDTI